MPPKEDPRVEALTLPPFSLLTADQRLKLASLCHADQCRPGDIVAWEGEPQAELILVASGRLIAGPDQMVKSYPQGSLLGSLQQAPWEQTFKAEVPTLVVRLPQENFFTWLKSYPVSSLFLKQIPGLSPAMLTHLAQHNSSKMALLTDDEHPLFEFRTSEWVIFVRLLGPLGGLLACLGAGLWSFFQGGSIAWEGILAAAVLVFLWGLVILVGGQLNLLLVTNRALILRTFGFSPLRIRHTRILREELRSLKVLRSGWASRLFSVVTVELATEGNVERFQQVPASRDLDEFVAYCQPTVSSEFDDQDLREILEESVGGLAVPQRLFWAAEQQGERTYRRHPAYLVARLTSGVFWLLVITGMGFLGSLLWPRGMIVLVLFLTPIACIPLAQMVSRFWSWKGSFLKFSGSRVIFRQQTPWRWHETLQEAPLSQLQEVRVIQATWWEMLMDIGTLNLYFGAEQPVTAQGFPHPGRIQAELFRMKEELGRQARRADQKQHFQDMARILKVWKQFSQGSLDEKK
ncbi:MAG: cyclic nucleotide-binding domain-containing protein [Spirochaetales bacterium]|nr:cyclic nucleotide-binding domain-containing protein [Spirochaetales bacterium]